MINPFINMDDKELMLKYQTDENLAFEVLYQRHSDKIYSYLAKRVHDKNEVDDLYQKVFVKFHKSRSLYDKKYDVLAWFYTITKSEFLDFLKKRKIESVSFDEKTHGRSVTKTGQDQFDIDISTEDSLNIKEKEALKLRYINDKDFDEISKLLKTSNSNARKLISRGLIKLKKKYKGAKQ